MASDVQNLADVSYERKIADSSETTVIF